MSTRINRDRQAELLGDKIDQIFRELGIDPSTASLAAFQIETFKPELFPARMMLHRINKGIARQALADIAGYGVGALEDWELGSRSPKLRDMVNWAEALNLNLTMRITSKSAMA